MLIQDMFTILEFKRTNTTNLHLELCGLVEGMNRTINRPLAKVLFEYKSTGRNLSSILFSPELRLSYNFKFSYTPKE